MKQNDWGAPDADGADPMFGDDWPDVKVEYHNPIPAWITMGTWSWLIILWILQLIEWRTALAIGLGVFITMAGFNAVLKHYALKRYRGTHDQ